MRLASWWRLLVAGAAGVLLAPGQQFTHLSGLIHDPSGAVVPGASVTVVNQETGFRRVVRSQSSGRYVVAFLQPGLYKITVRKPGFRTLIRYGVKLDAAQPVQLDFRLTLGSVQEVITVSGSRRSLQAEDASLGTLIGREWIRELPLNGRGLLGLLELAPGTVVTPATRGEPGQFSVSGQRPNTNYFVVDGVSANTGVAGGGIPARSLGGSLPGMTAIGSLHGLVSLEALEEFRVQTSTAAPEFGKLPGAHVLLSSRSGSNEFHGSVFWYQRHGAIDANSWLANRNGVSANSGLGMHDFGATFGGPLRRNKTFFFLSYEGMSMREPFAWQAPSPTEAARAQAPEWSRPVLELFPLPNARALNENLAEWRGRYERHSGFHVGSVRVDHAATSRLTFFARYNFAVSRNEYTTTQVNDLRLQSDSLTFGAGYQLSPRIVFDFKLNRSDARGRSHWRTPSSLPACHLAPVVEYFTRTDAGCNYLLRFSLAGLGQVVSGSEADQRQIQWHVLPTAVLALGAHQVRAGLDYRRYEPRRRDRMGTLSVIAENFDDLFVRRNLWVATSAPRNIESRLGEVSAFVQDTFRMHPRLTATFGLRWEYTRGPALAADTTSEDQPVYGLPDQAVLWDASSGAFAPRVGVAYRVREDGRLVLRAGWGIYYDSTLSVATDLVNGGPFSITQFVNGRNAPFSTLLSFAFSPDLRLPAVHQWNATMEGGLGPLGTLSVSYVGAAGRRLLRREFGTVEDSLTLWLAMATSNGASDYQGLQVQFRRPMTKGLQAMASYTWSHSLDNSSSDSLLHRTGSGLTPDSDRGSSDFDVRHNLNVAVTYETGSREGGGAAARLFSHWAIDGILRARTGFPINVLTSEYAMGLGFANAYRPDLVAGAPVWIRDRSAPGGRRLNREAFAPKPGYEQGNLGRNALRGFGMHQVDVAVHREFRLGEGRSLLLRLEAFNLFNHPNFADPTPFLSSPLFGESPSMLNRMLGTGSPGSGLTPVFQTGGPRSLQIVFRYRF